MIFLLFACVTLDDVDLDGVTVADGDCDDRDPSIFPGVEDPFGDGTDQNCDGQDGVDACALVDDAWIDLLNLPDPADDHLGYVFDIARYRYQVRGSKVLLMAESWIPFSLDDGQFQIDMHIDDDLVGYNLSYDSVRPEPSPVQLWSSTNRWLEPLWDGADRVVLCPTDDPYSICLGADLENLGFSDRSWLYAYVQVGWWAPGDPLYEDQAPDNIPWDDGVLCLREEPVAFGMEPTIDDSQWGDGDGVIEVGETVDLWVPVKIECGIAEGQLRAALRESVFGAASTVIRNAEISYGGTRHAPGDVLHPLSAFRVTIRSDSTTGANVLALGVTYSTGEAPLNEQTLEFDVYEQN